MGGISNVSAMENQCIVSSELVQSYIEIIKAVTRTSPSNSSAFYIDKFIDDGVEAYFDSYRNKKPLNKLSPFEAEKIVEKAKKRVCEERIIQKIVLEYSDASDSQKRQKHNNATADSNE